MVKQIIKKQHLHKKIEYDEHSNVISKSKNVTLSMGGREYIITTR
jgi:hypothetical protein